MRPGWLHGSFFHGGTFFNEWVAIRLYFDGS